MYLVVMQSRDGIRLHSARHMNDLLGCIAFGMRIIKNVAFENDVFDYIVSESKLAMKKFEDYCNTQDVKLIIKDLNQIDNLNKIKIE